MGWFVIALSLKWLHANNNLHNLYLPVSIEILERPDK